MGFKLIIVALLIFAGFYLLKKFRNPSNIKAQQPSANKMVACSSCKTHVPENEAIMQNGNIYCSKNCLYKELI